VVSDLAVDIEGLGDGVGVVGEWHEFGDAVVDGGGGGVGEGEKEGFGEGEGRAEDDSVDVLGMLAGDGGVDVGCLPCIAVHTGRAQRRS
jgi:hypothetical protein